ncbi:MAG: bacillithiol biosynthesis BshC [Planctomycetes bacterium]|nr:bacillithiol biosynthesis BshC [Planctomycetota bacterium]
MLSTQLLPFSVAATDPAALARQRSILEEHARKPLLERAAELARSAAIRPARGGAAAEAIEVSAKARGLSAGAQLSAARLRDPRAVAVITGQQPGFLGGPLYCILKAVHCVRFAQALEKTLGVPVVPLYWLHTDDHDIDEVRGIGLFAGRKPPVHVSVDLGRGRPFLSDVRLPASAAELWLQIQGHVPAGPDREKAIQWLKPEPGDRLADATIRLLDGLFGEHGLVPFEPQDLRTVLSLELADVIEALPSTLPQFQQMAASVRLEGLRGPFDLQDPPIVFQRTVRGRERVHIELSRALLPSGEGITYQELATRVRTQPELFSAGVASRVLVEALALPVAASIRGPGELAYSPFCKPLMPRQRSRPLPIEVPRWTATLVPQEIADLCTSIGLEPASLVDPAAAAPAASERAKLREELEIQQISADLRARLAALRDPLIAADGALARSVDKTLASTGRSMERLSRKVTEALDRKLDLAYIRWNRARAVLRPFGAPQERSIGALQFLPSGRTAFVNRLMETCDLVPTGHRLIPIPSL